MVQIKDRRITPENIFISLALINIAVMFAFLLLSNGAALEVISYGESNFGDFWAHVNRILYTENIYGNASDADAIFPPLVYCFLNIFAVIARFRADDPMVPVQTTGYGILCFMIYFVLFILLFITTVQYMYKNDSLIKKALVLFSLLFSYPFLGCAFERGNPVIYAMFFLMLGMSLRDSSRKFLREVSLIMVALAAGFKLYPAVFGILWIVEKRWKDVIKLIGYGVTAFFLPFVFYGGYRSIVDYLYTFSLYLGKDVYSKTSVIGNCIMLFGNEGKIVGTLLSICWIIWIGYYLFKEKKITWKSVALLTSTQTIMIAESYIYTFVFITIPLILFLNSLNERKEYSALDYIYAVLFALTFTCPPLVNIMSGAMIGCYVAWIAILMLISLEGFLNTFCCTRDGRA